MSQEQAALFIEMVRGDAALREEALALGADAKGIMALGERMDFVFTIQEFSAVLQAELDAKRTELSDDDLAAVAGGGIPTEAPTCAGSCLTVGCWD